jgi:probable rRNA maturation factor
MLVDFQDQTNQLTEEQIDLVEKLLDYGAQHEDILENAELSVSIVDNEKIQALNKTYRDKDEPTDVISFALQDEVAGSVNVVGNDLPLILGDIIISIDKAEEQSVEYNHSLERELGFLAIHGFLHLLGYNHMEEAEEKVMFKKQNDILDGFGLER